MTSVKELNLLSIDYGERFFGFAIKNMNNDELIPLEVIDSKKTNPTLHIKDLIELYDTDLIIIGNPIGLQNKNTRMSSLVYEFVKELSNITDVSINLIDERFSTKLNNQQKSKKRLDSYAAITNLETFVVTNV